MKTITRQSYAARIERARDYLLSHLDEDIDLARMARVANFSPYHFHRVYVAVIGETVAETVRRNRLNRAAIVADVVGQAPECEQGVELSRCQRRVHIAHQCYHSGDMRAGHGGPGHRGGAAAHNCPQHRWW